MNNTFSSEQIAKIGVLNADWIIRQYKLDKKANFLEIKTINPKLKQSEIAEELAISTSNFKKYRREINMHSPCRFLITSNSMFSQCSTRKQKTSNHTEHDLKLTSNELKVNSNDLKMSSNERIKKNIN